MLAYALNDPYQLQNRGHLMHKRVNSSDIFLSVVYFEPVNNVFLAEIL